METKRISTPACCGGKSLVFKLSMPINQAFSDHLKANGFDIAENFAKSGLLYATSEYLIVSGPTGSNRLQVKEKKASTTAIDRLETLIASFGAVEKVEEPDLQ